MTDFYTDVLTLIGMIVTLIGAGVAAWAVILRPEDAVKIGVSRWSGGSFEENMKLPMVKNLLWSSLLARVGLIAVAGGTSLQAVPVFCRLLN